MKSLSQNTIHLLLEELGIPEKRRVHSQEVQESPNVHGRELTQKLSNIIDQAILAVLQEMELPDDATIVLEGGSGREEATPGSDIDVSCYIPGEKGFEKDFLSPEGDYCQNMWHFFGAMGIKGYPTVLIPGDFKGDDAITMASMNLDARLLYSGGKGLSVEEIQTKVRSACEPFFVASRHERILQKFSYGEGNEFKVDFDIKGDRGGLRHLQHILWLLAAIEGTGLQSMYTEIEREDPEVYSALDLMLHIRSWLHLKKLGTKDKKIDLLNGSFWPELKTQFGDDIIERIQVARRAIIRYERTRILGEKKKGIKLGDGTKYGLLGLEIDNKSFLPKPDLVIQLLINAQKTGLKISPLVFSYLEKEARRYMLGYNEKYTKLILETGDFSETVRRLRSLGIIEQVFPGFSMLENQTYSPKHLHANITRIGRVLERLENLKNNTDGNLKDIHDTLTTEQQAGIRIALVCKDIPAIAEVSRSDYFGTLKKIHPSLPEGIKIAEHLVRKHKILFNCAHHDDWTDERELKRIATEIGSLDNLNALLTYTCAILDYGKPEYFHKALWDKTFALYHALREEMEGDTPEKQHKKRMMMMMRREKLSPEQDTVLNTAQDTFLRSRYVSAPESLGKTMMYLERAQDTGEPQIKITRSQEGSIRIIVSCQYNTRMAALITGTCFQNNITINDAEIHTFGTESPLAVFFLEAGSNTSNIAPGGQDLTITKLEKSLLENMKKGDISEIDYRDILQKSEPAYLLEKTNKTENYKFIVTAGNDTPGFLYALTKLIAEADVDILSTNIYTYPRHNGDSPHVEDTFILGPRNIDQLRKIIAEK